MPLQDHIFALTFTAAASFYLFSIACLFTADRAQSLQGERILMELFLKW